MKIVIMVEPAAAGAPATAVAPRQFDGVDDFARALARGEDVEVSVIEGPLDAAPSDGYLFAFGTSGLEKHRDLAQRLVILNADRGNVLKKLEATRALGAVEKQRYFRWRTEPDKEDGSGLFARKDLMTEIRASLVPGPFHSEHYGLCRVPGSTDLPSLLLGYLNAHRRSTKRD